MSAIVWRWDRRRPWRICFGYVESMGLRYIAVVNAVAEGWCWQSSHHDEKNRRRYGLLVKIGPGGTGGVQGDDMALTCDLEMLGSLRADRDDDGSGARLKQGE